MDITKGEIIILNGASSSGKTTLAKALQKQLEPHYFWLANDTFCDMCSRKHWDSDCVTAFKQAITGMIYTIRTFSDLGMNVIVDQVFLNDETEGGKLLQQCVEVLEGYPVFFVRVDCAVEELERRERQRKDRDVGQGRAQIPLVHTHGLYDGVVDTSSGSISDVAQAVISAMAGRSGKPAFEQLKERLDSTGSIYPKPCSRQARSGQQ